MKSATKLAVYETVESLLSESVAYKLHRAMCVRRLRRAGCIFVHIPKAAGTSVANAVIGRRAGHYTASELKATMGAANFEALFSFGVTRHPIERLWSAYHYAVNAGGTQGAMRYQAAYDSERFRSFDAFVNEWLVHQNLEQIDYVFRPQKPFLFDAERCLVDYIGTVENLGSVEARLSAELNRPIHLGRTNTSLASSKKQREISIETLEHVYELYRQDFVQFGYEIIG